MDADIGVKGTGGDCEGVPLGGGDRRYIEQKPLPRFVTHAGFGELNFEHIIGVADDFGDLSWTAGADFAVDSFDKIDTATPEFPAPAFISNAMTPERRPSKRRYWEFGISYKAAGCVGV